MWDATVFRSVASSVVLAQSQLQPKLQALKLYPLTITPPVRLERLEFDLEELEAEARGEIASGLRLRLAKVASKIMSERLSHASKTDGDDEYPWVAADDRFLTSVSAIRTDDDPHKIDSEQQFENTRNTVIVRLSELLNRPVSQLQSLRTEELVDMVGDALRSGSPPHEATS